MTWGQRSWWQWWTLCTCSCCWSSCVRPAWLTSLQPPASPELSPHSSLVHTHAHTHTHTMYTHTPFLSLSVHQEMICFWSVMCRSVSQPCSLCTALSRCCQPSTSPSPFQACPHSMSCESSFHTISSLHSMMLCYWSNMCTVVFPVTLFTFLSPSPGLLVWSCFFTCGVFCIIGKPVQL